MTLTIFRNEMNFFVNVGLGAARARGARRKLIAECETEPLRPAEADQAHGQLRRGLRFAASLLVHLPRRGMGEFLVAFSMNGAELETS